MLTVVTTVMAVMLVVAVAMGMHLGNTMSPGLYETLYKHSLS